MVEASFNGIDNFITYQNAHDDSIMLGFDVQKFTVLIDNEHYTISNVFQGHYEGTFLSLKIAVL